jgi:hypothetical protein
MNQWEYLTKFMKAKLEDADPHSHPELMTQENLAKFTPLAMIPEMNALGKKGWELVHMEPVHVGNNEDVLINAQDRNWTHRYFCVFKRPL